MAKSKQSRSNAASRRTSLYVLAAVVAVLIVWPLVYQDEFYMHVATLVLLAGVGAAGLHLILRTGQLFMAHAAFAGVGAYTSVIVMMRLQWPFPLALIAAIAVPALLALVLGPIILRLKGVYFVLVTFALGEVIYLVFGNATSLTGGSNGIYQIPPPAAFFASVSHYYYLALAAALLALAFVSRVLQSEVGRVLNAIREGESLSQSTGVPVLQFKVLAFVMAAGLAGAEGSLTAHFIRYISPLSFTFDQSLMYVVINVVGSMTSLVGVVIGTLFIVPLPEFLREFMEYQRVFFGLILMLTMAFAPNGLVGLWQGARRRWASRRGRVAA